MGSRCSQYQVLGEPTKLRRTSGSSVCEPCLLAGYTPSDPRRPSEELETSGKAKCAICPNLTLKPVEDEGTYVCSTCSAVFQTARTLLNDRAEEAAIVPTLTFARLAARPGMFGVLKGVLQETYGTESWGGISWAFQRKLPSVLPLGVLNGAIILWQKPIFPEVKWYPGTGLVRQVRIYVVSRPVKAQQVAELYGKVLDAYETPSDPRVRCSIRPEFIEPWVRLSIDPDIVLRQDKARRSFSDPSEKMPFFPAPELVQALCERYLAPVDRRNNGSFASLLIGRSGGPSMSARALIPAYAAWYTGIRAVLDHAPPSKRTVPHKARAHVARTLNRHLLGPCGLSLLPEPSWSSNDAVWKNVETFTKTFLKTEIQLLRDPLGQ